MAEKASMAKKTRSITKPKGDKNAAVPLPDTIFGRKPADYTVPVMKRVLAIFRKRIIKTETGHAMLRRLATLEQERPLLEQYAVTQLLRRSVHITRKAIAEWPDIRDEPEVERKNEGDLPEKTCDACQETLAGSAFRQSKITPDCKHACDLCKACMASWVASQLGTEDADWEEIRCPSCPVFLPPEAIRRYAAPVTLEDYNEFRVSFHLQDLPNFRWCSAAGCRSGQVHIDGETQPKMTCIKCGFFTCFLHGCQWYDGNRQDEHNKKLCARLLTVEKPVKATKGRIVKQDQNLASTAFILLKTKPCPRCKVRIEKTYGCDHMNCTQCLSHFSWKSVQFG